MKKFNLELASEKTSACWSSVPYAIDHTAVAWRRETGDVQLLGLLRISALKKKSNGRFTVLRQTIRKRLQAKLNAVKAELQRRMHEPIPEQGKWLHSGGAWTPPVLWGAHRTQPGAGFFFDSIVGRHLASFAVAA